MSLFIRKFYILVSNEMITSEQLNEVYLNGLSSRRVVAIARSGVIKLPTPRKKWLGLGKSRRITYPKVRCRYAKVRLGWKETPRANGEGNAKWRTQAYLRLTLAYLVWRTLA